MASVNDIQDHFNKHGYEATASKFGHGNARRAQGIAENSKPRSAFGKVVRGFKKFVQNGNGNNWNS